MSESLTNPSNAGIQKTSDDTDKVHTRPLKGKDWDYEKRREQDIENIWGRERTPRGNR